MSVSPKWFKTPVTDEDGKEVTGLKSIIVEAEREHRGAKEIAEAFSTALPTREVLIDNETYWDTEAEAWKLWREKAESDWVKEGESRANLYTARMVEEEQAQRTPESMKETKV